MNRFIHIAALTFVCCAMAACAEDPPPRLTGVHLQQVDTLYRSRIDSVRELVENTCEERHDERLEELVDSLVKLRRAEEIEMRERLLSSTEEDE